MCTQRSVLPVVLVLLALAVGADAGPVADTFARVKDSVVVIDFVERTPSLEVHGVSDRVRGSGSGVYIGDRRVLTAAHVVQVADEIAVEFTSGQILGARVLASVPAVDIALLELDAEPAAATVAQLGDPSRTAIGDRVLVVGAPRGISHTLTVGYLSARRAGDVLFGDMVPSELLQTDAAINPGNSGGPMFDLDGKVIGIVSSILTVSGGSEGLGFAVSANTVRSLLLEQRSTWTGIDAIFVEGEFAGALNIPQGAGVLVQRVAAGSPAEAIGLRGGTMIASIDDSLLLLGGDVILSLHGVALTEPRRLLGVRAALLNLEPGETVQLRVLRGGQVLELAWAVP